MHLRTPHPSTSLIVANTRYSPAALQDHQKQKPALRIYRADAAGGRPAGRSQMRAAIGKDPNRMITDHDNNNFDSSLEPQGVTSGVDVATNAEN